MLQSIVNELKSRDLKEVMVATLVSVLNPEVVNTICRTLEAFGPNNNHSSIRTGWFKTRYPENASEFLTGLASNLGNTYGISSSEEDEENDNADTLTVRVLTTNKMIKRIVDDVVVVFADRECNIRSIEADDVLIIAREGLNVESCYCDNLLVIANGNVVIGDVECKQGYISAKYIDMEEVTGTITKHANVENAKTELTGFADELRNAGFIDDDDHDIVQDIIVNTTKKTRTSKRATVKESIVTSVNENVTKTEKEEQKHFAQRNVFNNKEVEEIGKLSNAALTEVLDTFGLPKFGDTKKELVSQLCTAATFDCGLYEHVCNMIAAKIEEVPNVPNI